MGQLVRDTLTQLADVEALENNENDAIWFAGDLLNRFHTDFEWTSAFDFIDAEDVSAEEAEALKQAILEALRRTQHLATRAGLLSALSKTFDPTLRALFVANIHDSLRAIEGGSAVAGACLDFLASLGEDVLEVDEQGRSSQSWSDVEKNRREARQVVTRNNPDLLFPIPFDKGFPKG